MQVEARIQGIPCLIEVTHYTPADPGDHWTPGCDAEYEYEVLDRKGYPAAWLERKMTDTDHDNIVEILDNYDPY